MDKSHFPHKWERGRRFNVQSSNTLRRGAWCSFTNKADTIQGWKYEGDLVPRISDEGQQLSLDKQKRWEITATTATTPTCIVEIFNYPARTKHVTMVNGQNSSMQIRRSNWRSAQEDQEEQKEIQEETANPNKTRSKASQKRETQREREKRRKKEEDARWQTGTQVWQIERKRPDVKYLRQRQISYSGYRPSDDAKQRRLTLQREIKSFEKFM